MQQIKQSFICKLAKEVGEGYPGGFADDRPGQGGILMDISSMYERGMHVSNSQDVKNPPGMSNALRAAWSLVEGSSRRK